MKQPRKLIPRFRRALLALTAGLFLTVVAIEGGFRIAHMFSNSKKTASPYVPADWFDPKTIRIVTLGESTTAPSAFDGRDIAWPAQLEALLNVRFSRGGETVRFRILNLARAASSSPFQVARFEQLEPELKPDILISMLGINDSRVYNLDDDFLYANSYLVRFLYWADVAWSCPNCQELSLSGEAESRPQASEKARAGLKDALREFPRGSINSKVDLERFRLWIAEQGRLLGDERHLMNAVMAEELFAAAMRPEIRPTQLGHDLLIQGKSMLDSSYREMVLTRNSSLEHYCHFRTQLKEPGCVEAIKAAVLSGVAITPQLMTIAAQEGASKDEFLRRLYRKSGFDISVEKIAGTITAETFRRLATVTQTKNLIWMPMQYPTGSIGALEFYLNPSAVWDRLSVRDTFHIERGIYKSRIARAFLISNENFNEAEVRDHESAYFRDFFARDQGLNFGHTTEKGSARIATNVADQIEKSWPEIEPRIKAQRDLRRDSRRP